MDTGKLPGREKETHGKRIDINENTPLSDVKAPNIFERAKEEIEALVQTIHTNRDSTSDDSNSLPSEKVGKRPNFIKKAKQEIEEFMHFKHSRHHKETHGQKEGLDENTPIEEVKGPSVFARAKEEIEALVETLHHSRKESSSGGGSVNRPRS